MSRVTAAVRTARSLLARGQSGADVKTELRTAHPELTRDERKTVLASIRPDLGILGQSVHDPNLFKSCRAAASAKKKNPNRDLLIATVVTPMCASCNFRTGGKSCGLMGGKLIAAKSPVPEGLVHETVRLLVSSCQVDADEAESVVASEKPTNERLASLHALKDREPVDSAADLNAQAQSVRWGAMFDTSRQGVTIEPRKKRRQGGVIANRERSGLDRVEMLPGDKAEITRARRMAAAFSSDGVTIVPNKVKKRPMVTADAHGVTTVPGRERKVPRIAQNDRDLVSVQTQYDGTVATASKLLASGRMGPERAIEIHQTLDDLRTAGAMPDRLGKRMMRQVALLAGHLE